MSYLNFHSSMLKIFYGPDTFASRAKLGKVLDLLSRDEVTIVRFDEYSADAARILELAYAQDLFGGNTVVVLDSVLEHEKEEGPLLESLSELQKSPTIFLLLAGDVLAKTKKLFQSSGGEVVQSLQKEEKKKEEFSIFALADAFARRDKKSAWVLFTRARMKELGPQEICGTLMWQMRMILLAETCASAAEAGVSDFPFRKAKSFAKHFPRAETERMLETLIGLYHFDPKVNRTDLSVALERLILSL